MNMKLLLDKEYPVPNKPYHYTFIGSDSVNGNEFHMLVSPDTDMTLTLTSWEYNNTAKVLIKRTSFKTGKSLESISAYLNRDIISKMIDT